MTAAAKEVRGARKALLIIDQLPFESLKLVRQTHSFVADAVSVPLDYIPRTTPVGHATISTGEMPAEHRVQGRTWFSGGANRHRIEDICRGQLDAAIGGRIRERSLINRIRLSDREAFIIVVAAKAFIPHLLGCHASDLAFFPTDVKPRRNGDRFRIVVRAVAGNPAAGELLEAKRDWLQTLVREMAVGFIPGSVVGSEWAETPERVLDFFWTLPTDFGENQADVWTKWGRMLTTRAADVDRFYQQCATEMAEAAPPARGVYVLQSWFSTDYLGHTHGCQSTEYAGMLSDALASATTLAGDGYAVAVTSDHGGRPTPTHHYYDAFSQSAWDSLGAAIELPEGGEIVHSGDHLVGYCDDEPRGTEVHSWGGGTLEPIAVDSRVLANSFAPKQVPCWLVIPRGEERYSATRNSSGGGDHGACSEGNGISQVDNHVPALTLAGRADPAPKNLAGIADWFLRLEPNP